MDIWASLLTDALCSYCYRLLPSFSFKHHWLLFSFYVISYQVLPHFLIIVSPLFVPSQPIIHSIISGFSLKRIIINSFSAVPRLYNLIHWMAPHYQNFFFQKLWLHFHSNPKPLMATCYLQKKHSNPLVSFPRLFTISFLLSFQFGHWSHPDKFYHIQWLRARHLSSLGYKFLIKTRLLHS